MLTIGGSIDDPEDSDLDPGNRTKNQAIWGNWLWDFHSAVRFGLELSYWKTDYKEKRSGENFRVQTALIYSF